MSVVNPETIVIPFGNPALGPTDPGGMVLPIPVPSQIGIENGAASFTDGFVPLNMTDPALGGVLPSGQDMNGILYMLTSYCAWLQGGGAFFWNADFVAANTGYHIGAILKSASVPGLFFYNTVGDNPNDPDSDPTGWLPYSVLAGTLAESTLVAAAGVNLNPSVVGIGFFKLNTAAGAATFRGFQAGFTGQMISVTNLGPSNAIFNANDGAAPAAERFRLPSNLALVTNSTYTFRYSGSEWVPV